MVTIDRENYIIKQFMDDLLEIYLDYKTAIKEIESNNNEGRFFYDMYIKLAKAQISDLIDKLKKLY